MTYFESRDPQGLEDGACVLQEVVRASTTSTGGREPLRAFCGSAYQRVVEPLQRPEVSARCHLPLSSLPRTAGCGSCREPWRRVQTASTRRLIEARFRKRAFLSAPARAVSRPPERSGSRDRSLSSDRHPAGSPA